ncbi:MAG: SGNH/GDSL hydrolase family protein [Prevotella sp.]|nr:SGNH/GDSL hydrolase family protein [Prevotella sp.]
MKRTLWLTLTLLGCATAAVAHGAHVRQEAEPQMRTWQHPWQGARVAFLGDSITDPRNKASQKKYWWWLQQWLDIEPYVYGVSGRQWNDVPRQAAQLMNDHGQHVDAIVIFMGTNDWNNDVPLGRWYNYTEDSVVYAHGGNTRHNELRRHRSLSTDLSSFRGRINVALDSLKRMYPTKQIVLLTPVHRARFYANDKNWQPTEDYANRHGLFIDDYVQCVREAASVWAVPVIDWNATSGLYPMHEQQDYFGHANDRLHPNDLGHRRMAMTLLYQLLALPARF